MDEIFAKYDWNTFFKSRPHPVHKIHPYFAKFDAYIPRSLIEELTKPGDVVFDPFAGSGTTLVEANLAGRNAIGNDSNPLACLVARTKVTPLHDKDKRTILDFLAALEASLHTHYGNPSLFTPSNSAVKPSNIPQFHNREYWFNPTALRELAIIKGAIEQLEAEPIRQVCSLSFSRIIVFASNQQTESRYKRVDKNRRPFEIFGRYKTELIKAVEAIINYTALVPKGVTSTVYNDDSRKLDFLEDGSVDFIVNSPPYLNSWDYGLYHRFRFFWLDMDVRAYEAHEIGKHLRTLEGRTKVDELERYKLDMSLCLQEFSRVLKPGKYCCIVNANSVVRKQFIDTNAIITTFAAEQGLRLVHVINRNILGPHFGMHAALVSKKIVVEDQDFKQHDGRIGKTEQILVFKKD